MAWFRRRRAEREAHPEAPATAAPSAPSAPSGPTPSEPEPAPQQPPPPPLDVAATPLARPDVAPEEEATSAAEYASAADATTASGPSDTVADVAWSDGARAVVVGVVHAGVPGDDDAAADAVRSAIEQGLARAVSDEVVAGVPEPAREDYPVIVSVRIAEDTSGDAVGATLTAARKQFARGGRIRLVVDVVPRDELSG